MNGPDNIYSHFVTWSKIILPLAGIALLSTMFLFARDSGPAPAIPFAEMEEIAREPRVSDPRFAGVTADGSTISLSARSIRPDPEQPSAFSVEEIEAEIDAPDGSTILIIAGTGEVDPTEGIARLSGLARLTASSGYMMETEGLVANLETGVITSLGPLEVRTPYGELTAGQLEVVATPNGQSQRMVFNDGVRLLYQPQIEEP